MKKITIAIDGYSACGKSTTAKAVADALAYVYVDSGAMYRAVSLYMITQKIDLDNKNLVMSALENISIEFHRTENHSISTFLNGNSVEDSIRKMEVSNLVSKVAAIPEVRKAMVSQQQELGLQKGIVMDGRDIGTVVFPSAELKIFMTASPEIRAQRRLLELEQKGVESSLEEVKKNLLDRDHLDTTRADSPLSQAEDAVIIDNSYLSFDEQVAKILELAKERIEK